MKFFILILIWVFTSSAYAVVIDREIPLEMNSFQVKYSDISKKGSIRVKDCSRCEQEIYEFDEKITIKRNGKIITLKDLLSEHWKVTFPTIFLEINDKKVIRINY